MGSITFDFLSQSFLFDSTLIIDAYSSLSEEDLSKELERYRTHVLSQIPALEKEIQGENSSLRLFGAKDYFKEDNLLQTALYIDQVVLPDPLLPFTHLESENSRVMSKLLGFKRTDVVDRRGLAAATDKMRSLTPMVAANYIKFFPLSYYLEPSDNIPLTYSDNGYSDLLPPNVLRKYRDQAAVKSLIQVDRGWAIAEDLKIGRGISVEFNGDSEGRAQFFNLLEQEIIDFDESTGLAQFVMRLPESPPEKEAFMCWVSQSVNQTANTHYSEIVKSLSISSQLGASYLTSSPFTHSLLGSNFSNKSIQSFAADHILNMDLPFLRNVSMHDLMKIRTEDGEAFDSFRRELEAKFREIRLEDDPERARISIENAVHELSENQVSKINQKISGLRRGALANTVVGLGGLAGAVATSGLSVLSTVIALASGYKSYVEYRRNVRENPAYFLWKVKSK